MILRHSSTSLRSQLRLILVAICVFAPYVNASWGDRQPEFRDCVEICKQENCVKGLSLIPLGHRLLFWDCPSECDYTCQHIITDQRVARGEPVVQYHGKWPFYRFLGMQEPFSVLFSLMNFMAHQDGLSKVLANIPASYTMRKYYIMLAYFGMASWVFSMIFHTRDFRVTEQLDYFAAGGSVLYGLYYTTVRLFGLDRGGPRTKSLLRVWTTTCIAMYIAHVTYLKWFSWDYTYNMAANVAAGLVQNAMWSWYSIQKYKQSKRPWAAWPGIVVAWIFLAMSLELLDFPPIWGCLDAHSLWHLGTVIPTIIWYKFLLEDAADDLAAHRLKA